MIFCIEPKIADQIVKALKTGDIDIAKLYEMNSSAERRAVWESYVDKGLAKFINTEFEKAFVSESKTAVQDLLQKLTQGQTKDKTKTANLLDKVKKLDEKGLLDKGTREATFTDLVSDALGISVTQQEAQEINKRAKEIEVLGEKLKQAEFDSKKGATAKEQMEARKKPTLDYFAALVDMDKYVNSMSPTHNLKVATGSIGRGNMLLNIGPATVNVISNAVQGVSQALERRIALRQATGANSEYAAEYFKMAVEVFHKTGYDISRMFGEDIRLGEHLIHNEGPGIIRKFARGQAKVAYKWLLGYGDVVSSSAARADSSNIAAMRVAKEKGKQEKWTEQQVQQYADNLFQESTMTTTDPFTDIGEDAAFVKAQAVADAQLATWTNKSFVSDVALGFRNWLNSATGDLQLGFWTIPFVKTGANVLQIGIESSPAGLAMAGFKVKPAIAAWKDKNLPVRERMKPMQEMARLAVRSGLGFTFSAIFVAMLDPEDFFGAYDVMTQKRRDELGLKKGVYNAIRIGDRWISLDYFGPLAASIVGMMYARKYGKNLPDAAFKFGQGVGQQTLQIPGVANFEDIYSSWKKVLTAESASEMGKYGSVSIVNNLRSRVIPGIFGSIAKGIDKEVRKVDRKSLTDGVISMIPVASQTLPSKVDITTGKPIESEGFLTTVLAGSRLKKANQNELIDEISRLIKAGHGPAIAPVDRSSEKAQQLRDQVSQDEYQEAREYFGRTYSRLASAKIKTVGYSRASDERKKDILNSLRTKARNSMLAKYTPKKQNPRPQQNLRKYLQ